MKRLSALLFLAALLTGCVAVPYDTYGSYQSAPVVSGYYSSGYANGYHSPAPVYVSPAPVYVSPGIQFNYSRSYSPRAHAPVHRHGGQRADGRRDSHPRAGWDGRGSRGHDGPRGHGPRGSGHAHSR